MLSLLNKLKKVEEVKKSAEVEQVPSSAAADDIKAAKSSSDNGEIWLHHRDQPMKGTEIACYDTKVTPVPRDELVWAKCAGFKAAGSKWFPARICKNEEILSVCDVNQWPLPPEVAVVEFFDIPKTLVNGRVVQVLRKDLKPYYERYNSKNSRITDYFYKHVASKKVNGENDDFDDEEIESPSDHEASPDEEEEDLEQQLDAAQRSFHRVDYEHWDVESMDQMHMVRATAFVLL